jgi:hypothetical protein
MAGPLGSLLETFKKANHDFPTGLDRVTPRVAHDFKSFHKAFGPRMSLQTYGDFRWVEPDGNHAAVQGTQAPANRTFYVFSLLGISAVPSR